MRPPNRPPAIRHLGVTVAVALCVSLSGLLATTAGSHRVPGPGDGAAIRVGASPVAPDATPLAAVPAAGAPTSWSGTTVATLLPNYNASLPGNFRSLVDDWEVGTPAVVPSTGTVWWPELPVSVDGSPAPTSAPALLYNLSSESFVGIDQLVTNISAFAYDPETKTLFATDPINDTVEEINPLTGVPTGTEYHVGLAPSAIALDSSTGYLFVANAGSNNVTVINPLTRTVPWASIAVGNDPIALADDGPDGWMYVGNGASAFLSRLDVSSPTDFETTTLLQYGPARGVAFSAKSDYLAVTTDDSSNLTAVFGKTGAVHTATIGIGIGFSAVATTPNGSTFIIANSTGDSIALVNTSTFAVSPLDLKVGLRPTSLVAVPTIGTTLVWNSGTRNVSVIASSLASVKSATTTLAPAPNLLEYYAPLNRLYVGDEELPGIEVLNPFTGATEAPPIVLPSPPLSLALDAGSRTLYVALAGEVMAYNVSTGLLNAQDAHLPGANAPIAVDLTSGLLWVGRPASGDLQALSATSLESVGPVVRLEVSSSDPESLVFEAGSNSILAVNSSSGQIVQFNGTDGAWIGSPVSVGPNVTALAWDPVDGLVYAAGDELSAINPSTMTIVLPSTPLAPHINVGGITYEASREAIYVGTWTNNPYSGSLTVVNGSSPSAASSSLTVVPTGFEPSAIVTVEGSAGSLPDSGTILTAAAESGTISVVASPPQILYAAFEPAKVDENVSSRLIVAAAGGATTSSVDFTGLPSGCSPPTGFTVDCTPTAEGMFDVLTTVTDAFGETASAEASITVSSALSLAATVGTLASHDVDLKVPVTMSAEASGGSPQYTYTWNFGDGSTASGASVSHTFEETGEFIVAVTVTDQGGGRTVNETLVDVVADPTVHLSATPGVTTDVNLTVELAASVTGGAGPGSGAWQFGDGTGSSSSTKVGHAWQTAGLYDVNYTFTDALGQQAKASLSILVDPELTGEFSITPLSSNPVIGTTFDFNATLENGTRAYTVEWSFGDDSTAVGAEVTHAYAASGTYEVEVSAVDAAGAYLNSTFPGITVGPGPSRAAPLFGGGFGPPFILGLILGGAVAAVALFIAERTRKAGPVGPPSPYVPPPPPVLRGRS
jgi:YVTN family beta-propeller protein